MSKMSLEPHTESRRKRSLPDKCKQLFQRLYKSFLAELMPHQVVCSRELLISLFPDSPVEFVLLLLESYTGAFLIAGDQVRVELLKEQSTNEHIGYWSYWYEETLIFREALYLPKECAETTGLVFRPVTEQVQLKFF